MLSPPPTSPMDPWIQLLTSSCPCFPGIILSHLSPSLSTELLQSCFPENSTANASKSTPVLLGVVLKYPKLNGIIQDHPGIILALPRHPNNPIPGSSVQTLLEIRKPWECAHSLVRAHHPLGEELFPEIQQNVSLAGISRLNPSIFHGRRDLMDSLIPRLGKKSLSQKSPGFKIHLGRAK